MAERAFALRFPKEYLRLEKKNRNLSLVRSASADNVKQIIPIKLR